MVPNDRSSPNRPPRPRSRKHKHGPKKQPQRGLGVAQLEKLRLEEQSKLQDAASSLASMHHPLPPLSENVFSIPDRRCFHQQLGLSHDSLTACLKEDVIGPPSIGTAVPHHHHHQQCQQQQQLQPNGPILAPCTTLNYGRNEVKPFHVFPSMALATASADSRQCFQVGTSLPRRVETEPCLSQSVGSGICSAMSLGEQLSIGCLEYNDKRFLMDEPRGLVNPPTFFYGVLTSQGQAGITDSMQIEEERKTKDLCENDKPMISFFKGIFERKAARNDASSVLKDWCLLDVWQKQSSSPWDQPRIVEEASTNISATDSSELSSFQNTSSDKDISLWTDQISGKKRPWIFMQEMTESLKDMLLRTLVQDNYSEDMLLRTLVQENYCESKEQGSSDTDELYRKSICRSASLVLGASPDFLVKTEVPVTVPAGKYVQYEVGPPTPENASRNVNNLKDRDPTSEIGHDFLTLGLGTCVGKGSNNLQGQYEISDMAKMKEMQVYHSGAAATRQLQRSCRNEEKVTESKEQLQPPPWMLAGSSVRQFCVEEILLEAKKRSAAHDEEAEEEEQEKEGKSTSCLDLRLKLSL